MDKSKICFIRAKLKKDYVFDGIAKSGYRIVTPYTDRNIVLRVCRELWKKLKLPKISIWYNKETKNIEQKIIIVKDPIITTDFMRFLREHNPDRYIIFDYDNRVSRSLDPESIRTYVDEIWSYDEDDCKQFRLKYKGNAFLDVYQIRTNPQKKYDVFYVGRDKGRLDQIYGMEKSFKKIGLKTYFYICADREYLTWTKKMYKHFLPYEGYMELLSVSKAVLNIVPIDQKSITQREMEAVFDGVKCITNNRGILDFDLYDDSRYFYLDSDNIEELEDFLNSEFKPVDEKELDKYRFDAYLARNLGL